MNLGMTRYAAHQPKLRSRDGREFPGYFNDTAGNSSRAVIVMHDFFGLTPQVRSVASRLANAGYLAFAPDLYRGRVAKNRDEAAALAGGLAWNRVAVELGLVVSTVKQLRPGTRVAALGFAMGGAAALVAAAAVEQLDAAVTFYGIPQDVRVENKRLRVQGHFAARDTKCTPDRVERFGAALADAGVAHELHVYEADNGFCSVGRTDAYSPEHAEQAWARSIAFLRTSLD